MEASKSYYTPKGDDEESGNDYLSRWPVCPGYLDKTLEIFEQNEHAFIVVSTLAMTWCGLNLTRQREIDVLIRSSKHDVIVRGLIESGDWQLHYQPHDSCWEDQSMINTTPFSDTWLQSCLPDPQFKYLRLWSETLYHLSIDCHVVAVPDVTNNSCVLVGEEYYRDLHERFGPPRLSRQATVPVPWPQMQAKLRRKDIPIFIPNLEDHLNALLAQVKMERELGVRTGGTTTQLLTYAVRYPFFDWEPAGSWLLMEKIQSSNRDLMKSIIDRFKRKPLILWDTVLQKSVFNKKPWELSIKGQDIGDGDQVS